MKTREIRLYDSLSGEKRVLETDSNRSIKVYCCGPTVYGYTHVGNARAALTLDLFVRTLEYFGYPVKAARNFTDVDDKIIQAGKQEGKSPLEIARFYEAAYAEEMKSLGIRQPDFSPRATEHIPSMIEMISGLIAKEIAYTLKTKTGTDVYYRVNQFKDYGKLSKRSLDAIIEGTRAETEQEKEHPADFALWKSAKPDEPSWDSPWGKGRPGWHIECSAMIDKLFASTLDVHIGGLDLIFPHHENEIAQSEGLREQTLAKFWMHNGMIEIDREKMSKSLGNIMKTGDFLDRYGPETLRMLIYSHHYRSPIDFSPKAVYAAETSVAKLYQTLLEAQNNETDSASPSDSLSREIESALRDDFNSAKALGLLLGAARKCFKENSTELWAEWKEASQIIASCLGLFTQKPAEAQKRLRALRIKRTGLSDERIEDIEQKIEQRQQLRLHKRYDEADKIRLSLEKDNILVMDTPEGSAWSVREDIQ